jgi:hypothetical protein
VKAAMDSSDECRNKNRLGDIGEFMVLVAVSSYNIKDPELVNQIYREYFAR